MELLTKRVFLGALAAVLLGATPPTYTGNSISPTTPALNASFYGMKCDNSHDDTVALQTAVTVAGLAFGGHVILPAGVCKISSTIVNSYNNVYVDGLGYNFDSGTNVVGTTTLKWTGGTHGTIFAMTPYHSFTTASFVIPATSSTVVVSLSSASPTLLPAGFFVDITDNTHTMEGYVASGQGTNTVTLHVTTSSGAGATMASNAAVDACQSSCWLVGGGVKNINFSAGPGNNADYGLQVASVEGAAIENVSFDAFPKAMLWITNDQSYNEAAGQGIVGTLNSTFKNIFGANGQNSGDCIWMNGTERNVVENVFCATSYGGAGVHFGKSPPDGLFDTADFNFLTDIDWQNEGGGAHPGVSIIFDCGAYADNIWGTTSVDSVISRGTTTCATTSAYPNYNTAAGDPSPNTIKVFDHCDDGLPYPTTTIESGSALVLQDDCGGIRTYGVHNSDNKPLINWQAKDTLALNGTGGVAGIVSTNTAGQDIGPTFVFIGQTGNASMESAFAAIRAAKKTAAADGNYAGYLSLQVMNSGGALHEQARLDDTGGFTLPALTASLPVCTDANKTLTSTCPVVGINNATGALRTTYRCYSGTFTGTGSNVVVTYFSAFANGFVQPLILNATSGSSQGPLANSITGSGFTTNGSVNTNTYNWTACGW